MTTIKWDGNVYSPFAVPENLTKETKVRVWSKEDGSDSDVGVAGDFDWRHFNTLTEGEQVFLSSFDITAEQDINYYEVISD